MEVRLKAEKNPPSRTENIFNHGGFFDKRISLISRYNSILSQLKQADDSIAVIMQHT